MDDDGRYYKRQGFWLRMARERSGKSQKGAAIELGLSENSKSTISDYETGEQVAPQPALRKLARWYKVPINLFTHPPLSADEVIERLLDEASRSGEDAERREWFEGEGRDPATDDGPTDAPGTLSA